MSGIRLSKQYGVNPSVLQCPICGKEFGLAMFGTSWKDRKTGKTAKAPHVVALPNQICDDCKKVLDQGGCFFIEVKDEDANNQVKNPYRTGRITAIKKEASERIFGQVNPVTYMGESIFEQVFGEALKNTEMT